MNVGIDRKAHAGKHVSLVQYLASRQPDRLTQPKPGLDPSFPLCSAVVVANPVVPEPPYLGQGAIGEDGRILDWDVPLVVETVGDPAAQLRGRQSARIHGAVERMPVVISPVANGA